MISRPSDRELVRQHAKPVLPCLSFHERSSNHSNKGKLRAPVGIPLMRPGSLLFPNHDTGGSDDTVDYFGFVTPLGAKDLARACDDGPRRSEG